MAVRHTTVPLTYRLYFAQYATTNVTTDKPLVYHHALRKLWTGRAWKKKILDTTVKRWWRGDTAVGTLAAIKNSAFGARRPKRSRSVTAFVRVSSEKLCGERTRRRTGTIATPITTEQRIIILRMARTVSTPIRTPIIDCRHGIWFIYLLFLSSSVTITIRWRDYNGRVLSSRVGLLPSKSRGANGPADLVVINIIIIIITLLSSSSLRIIINANAWTRSNRLAYVRHYHPIKICRNWRFCWNKSALRSNPTSSAHRRSLRPTVGGR